MPIPTSAPPKPRDAPALSMTAFSCSFWNTWAIVKPKLMSESEVRITDISVRSADMRVRWNDMPVRRAESSIDARSSTDAPSGPPPAAGPNLGLQFLSGGHARLLSRWKMWMRFQCPSTADSGCCGHRVFSTSLSRESPLPWTFGAAPGVGHAAFTGRRCRHF